MPATPWAVRRGPAALGEDTVGVLCAELGYARGEVARMKERGVV
jgi:hypothetical protein